MQSASITIDTDTQIAKNEKELGLSLLVSSSETSGQKTTSKKDSSKRKKHRRKNKIKKSLREQTPKQDSPDVVATPRILSTKNILQHLHAVEKDQSELIAAAPDESSALLPKPQSGLSLPDGQIEEPEPQGYAEVYIWNPQDKKKQESEKDRQAGNRQQENKESQKRLTGHVSMRLFTAEGHEIPWEEGGYISVYPLQECHLTIQSTMPTRLVPDSYLLIKKDKQDWGLFYINSEREIAKEINIDATDFLKTAIPHHKKPEELSNAEKVTIKKAVRAYINGSLPNQEICYLRDVNQDKIAEGGELYDVKFRVWNINVCAMQNHFNKIRTGKMKWTLTGSGCLKGKESTNCVGIVFELLIKHGGLYTNFKYDQYRPGSQEFLIFHRARASVNMVEREHDSILPSCNLLNSAMKIATGVLFTGCAVKLVRSLSTSSSTTEFLESVVAILAFGCCYGLCDVLKACLQCCMTVDDHLLRTPRELTLLLIYLCYPAHLQEPEKLSVSALYIRGLEQTLEQSVETDAKQEDDLSHPSAYPEAHRIDIADEDAGEGIFPELYRMEIGECDDPSTDHLSTRPHAPTHR